MKSARAVAVQFLLTVDFGQHCDALGREPDFVRLQDRDRRLAFELVFGTLRFRGRLDYYLNQLSRMPLDRIDSEVLWILRLGLYQLEFTRVPPRAAVHESVALCRQFRKTSAGAFVNALLRQFQRKRPVLPTEDSPAGLAVLYSHPEWLVKRYVLRHGLQVTRRIMDQNNRELAAPLWVNPFKTGFEEFRAILRRQDIQHREHPECPGCVEIDAGFSEHSLYREGYCFFMDAGSQQVANRVRVEGCRIVGDFCAAPGSKSFLLSSRIAANGRLYCSDLSWPRLGQMRQRAQLCRIPRLHYFLCDWSTEVPVRRVFDSVLLDVPCSGLGTLAGHPDIRWRVSEDDLTSFGERQLAMLRNAFQSVRPGGEILYATCSTEPEENEQVVEQFLTEEPRARRIGSYWRTTMDSACTGGFFTARIRHVSDACATLL